MTGAGLIKPNFSAFIVGSIATTNPMAQEIYPARLTPLRGPAHFLPLKEIIRNHRAANRSERRADNTENPDKIQRPAGRGKYDSHNSAYRYSYNLVGFGNIVPILLAAINVLKHAGAKLAIANNTNIDFAKSPPLRE